MGFFLQEIHALAPGSFTLSPSNISLDVFQEIVRRCDKLKLMTLYKIARFGSPEEFIQNVAGVHPLSLTLSRSLFLSLSLSLFPSLSLSHTLFLSLTLSLSLSLSHTHTNTHTRIHTLTHTLSLSVQAKAAKGEADEAAANLSGEKMAAQQAGIDLRLAETHLAQALPPFHTPHSVANTIHPALNTLRSKSDTPHPTLFNAGHFKPHAHR